MSLLLEWPSHSQLINLLEKKSVKPHCEKGAFQNRQVDFFRHLRSICISTVSDNLAPYHEKDNFYIEKLYRSCRKAVPAVTKRTFYLSKRKENSPTSIYMTVLDTELKAKTHPIVISWIIDSGVSSSWSYHKNCGVIINKYKKNIMFWYLFIIFIKNKYFILQ